LGRISIPAPIVKYLPQLGTQPSPLLYKDTAYTGFLRYSTVTKKYYLETGDSEAISLTVPANVNLGKFVGRRIFATGSLNLQSQILTVSDTTDLELLPTQVTTIPETVPSSSVTSPIQQ